MLDLVGTVCNRHSDFLASVRVSELRYSEQCGTAFLCVCATPGSDSDFQRHRGEDGPEPRDPQDHGVFSAELVGHTFSVPCPIKTQKCPRDTWAARTPPIWWHRRLWPRRSTWQLRTLLLSLCVYSVTHRVRPRRQHRSCSCYKKNASRQ